MTPLAADPQHALQLLRKAIESGGDLLTALLNASEQRALAAASLPRRFNAEMYATIIAPSAEADVTSFERLRAVGALADLPGRTGWYAVDAARRMRRVAKGEAFAPRSPSWRALHERLAQAFAADGADGWLEQLYHRLSLSDESAEKAWQQRFAEERDRFDLARCENLLELLADRAAFVSPALASLGTRERGLLGARAALADDYARTGRYLERHAVLGAFESLRPPGPCYILQLHAAGGSGKTMFLRWLGARWCLPREVPIARVDFDFLDESERALASAFLLGKLAERLDPHLRGAPLFELLRDVAEERRRSTARRSAGQAAAEVALRSPQALEREVRERLASVLVEHAAGRLVVLVFDTLEDATLKHQIDVLELVTAIDALRNRTLELAAKSGREAPRLLLILSGRYTLEEQYPAVAQRYSAHVVSCEVTPFDARESLEYLQRRLTGLVVPLADGLLDAIVRRAGGSPFKLALYADIVLGTPSIGVGDLGQESQVDTLYLIERVLKRLADPRLRWVLRYGVLARRLTRPFVEQVLLPIMKHTWRAGAHADDPGQDGVTHRDWLDLWRSASESAASADAAALWQSLRDYCSASSWVRVDATIGEAVVIQPVVGVPMRRALLHCERPVVQRIHKAAIAHARKTDGRRDEADRLVELAYHDFMLRGPRAARAWWQQLSKLVEDESAAAQALASLPLSSDLADTGQVPDWVQAAAHFVLAQRLWTEESGSGDAGSGTRRYMQAREHFQAFERITAKPGVSPPLAPAEVALLRLALADGPQQQETALHKLEAVLRKRLDGPQRSHVLLTLERGYRERDPARARRYGSLWEQQAHRDGDASAYAEAVIGSAQDAAARALPRRALRQVHTALGQLTPASGLWRHRAEATDARRQLQQRVPGLLVWCGVVHAALASQQRQLTGDEVSDLSQVETADILEMAGEVREARTLVARLLQRDARQSNVSEGMGPALRAHLFRIESRAARQVFDFGASLNALSESMSLLAAAGDHDAEVDTRLHLGRVLLHDVGNLRQAAEQVRDDDGAMSGESADLRLEHLLLRASLHKLRGDPDSAADLFRRARKVYAEVQRPAWLTSVRVAQCGLACGAADQRVDEARNLVDLLAACDSPGLRLASLRELHRMDAIAGLSAALATRLDRLCRVQAVGLPGYQRLLPADRIRLTLQRVELLRVVGRPEAAVATLRSLRQPLSAQPSAVWLRHVALACDRLGLAPSEVLPGDWLTRLVSAQRRMRPYCGALLTEAASRAVRAQDWRGAARSVAHALPILDEPGSLAARWHVRLLSLAAMISSRDASLLPALKQAELRERATKVANDLGLPASRPMMRDEVAVPPIATAVAQTPLTTPDGGSGVIVLSVDPKACALFVDDAGVGKAQPRGAPRPLAPLWLGHLLHELGGGRLNGEAMWDAANRIGWGSASFGRMLAQDLLPQPIFNDVLETLRNPLGLVILHPTPSMHAVPWELLELPMRTGGPLSLQRGLGTVWRGSREDGTRERTRRVQRQLGIAADGRFGPATRAALQAWQSRQGIAETGLLDAATLARLANLGTPTQAPPAVLLIRPGQDVEQSNQRGSSTGGADLEWIYREHGFETSCLTEPNREALQALLRERPWSVVHIATPIAQSRSSGEITLQFAASHETARTTVFSASLLARVLQSVKYAGAGVPPLIIVDTPRPTDRNETARQLLLRNAFAAMLFEHGELPVVVAMGLAVPEQQGLYTNALARAAMRPTTPAALVQTLRDVGLDSTGVGAPDRDPLDLLPSAGIALFAQDPLTIAST